VRVPDVMKPIAIPVGIKKLIDSCSKPATSLMHTSPEDHATCLQETRTVRYGGAR